MAELRAEGTDEISVEQWARMDEDQPGELVGGRLEEEEMPTILHEAVVSWLFRTLAGWLAPRGGWVFGSEHKLIVGPGVGRKPDVVAYFPDTPLPARHSSAGRHPPDLVVEVLSAQPRDGRRDRVDKKREYASFGVRWYWLVDPELRTLEIHELGGAGRYQDALTASEGAHEIAGLEGLRVDLDALWDEVDRLPE